MSVHYKTRELYPTAYPRSSICKIDLLAMRTTALFAREWTRPSASDSYVGTGIDLPTRTACWPTVIVADVSTGQRDTGTLWAYFIEHFPAAH